MSDVLSSLRDVADALTNPSQHRTPRHAWPKDRRNRNKIKLDPHVVVLPGLLTQVAALAFPLGVDGEEGASARSVPQSRPPGNPLALAAYLDISIALKRWAAEFGVQGRETSYATLRGVLGAAPAQPYDRQCRLLSDMHEWLSRCEEIAGWVTRDPILTVPCPVCTYRTLHVDLEESTVRCISCGARWAKQESENVGSLSALGRYATKYREEAGSAAAAARAEERRRKAARWGRAPGAEPP